MHLFSDVVNQIIHQALLRQILRGGVNTNHSQIFGPDSKGNSKSGNTLGTNPTTVVVGPCITPSDTIKIEVPHGGNSAAIICYFTGTGGDPKISITDGTTTQN